MALTPSAVAMASHMDRTRLTAGQDFSKEVSVFQPFKNVVAAVRGGQFREFIKASHQTQKAVTSEARAAARFHRTVEDISAFGRQSVNMTQQERAARNVELSQKYVEAARSVGVSPKNPQPSELGRYTPPLDVTFTLLRASGLILKREEATRHQAPTNRHADNNGYESDATCLWLCCFPCMCVAACA